MALGQSGHGEELPHHFSAAKWMSPSGDAIREEARIQGRATLPLHGKALASLDGSITLNEQDEHEVHPSATCPL